jgi:hypothetical protein
MKNQIKLYSKFIAALVVAFVLLDSAGCKKAIDIGPPINKVSSVTVFTTDATAESAIAGVLGSMAVNGGMANGSGSISLQQGQAADELVSYATSPLFYTNSLVSKNSYYWTEIYQELFQINTAITALNANTASTLTPAIRNQLLGEMKFARAFIYFNAVNLYGDVPMPLTADYVTNGKLSRTPQQQVYAQVIQDLKDAQLLLPDNSYLSGTGVATTDRVHPNKQAAMAMLARVYLYQKDWANAQAMATAVISASSYKLEATNSVFLKTSQEAIWQLFPVTVGLNNADAQYLIINQPPTATLGQLSLNANLLNAFEPGDARFVNWVGSFTAPAVGTIPATTYQFAYKYKNNSISPANPVTEYPIMLRLAEQYLIRAEAYIQTGQIALGIADLNTLRTRARMAATATVPDPLPPLAGTLSQPDAMNAVLHERQVELFTEMGHRWFDLRRTGKIDAVMNVVTPQKGSTWSSYKQLIPIPVSEIILNPNLVQNPGYN